MTAANRLVVHGWLIAMMALTSVGCQTPNPLASAEGAASPQRKLRLEAVAREFDVVRDTAEFHAAEARWDQGDTSGCIDRLEKLLRRSPDHLEARLLLTEVLLCEDRPQEALEWIQPALASHAEDARVHDTMGLLLEKIGRGSEAQRHYEKAASLKADHEAYGAMHRRTAGSLQYSGDAHSSERALRQPDDLGLEPERTVRLAHYVVEGEPDVAFVDQTRVTPARSRRIVPGAQPTRSAAGAHDPGFAEATDVGGTGPAAETACFAKSTEGKGRAVTTAHVAPTPPVVPFQQPGAHAARRPHCAAVSFRENTHLTAEQLLEEGRKALGSGASERALAHFWDAVLKKPQDPQIPISAAVSALRYDQPELAIDLLEPAIGVCSESAALYRILGTAYYRRGEFRASQVALQQALSLDNSSALSYFLLGCTLAKLGRLEAAEEHFRRAAAIDPKYAVRRRSG